jgi:hypothetical protein
MDITVKGLRHPHRYVLDAAQTHIYMLMKKVGWVCAEDAQGPGRKGRPHVDTALPVVGCRIGQLSTGLDPP